MFKKIQDKCPWKDIDLWRHNTAMCSANNRPCCQKNCAIFQCVSSWSSGLIEKKGIDITPDLAMALHQAHDLWDRYRGRADLFSDEKKITLTLSTGGWSENEDVIDSMRMHPLLWVSCCKVEDPARGFYRFELKKGGT